MLVAHVSSKQSFLAERGLKPSAVLAEGRPHGTRLRYLGGCRCDLCRKANTNYERERLAARKNGDWNGLVSAEHARRHLLALAAQGVGRRAVADVSDVPSIILHDIRLGRKASIRARTERRILAVTADMAADHALIDAAPTWRLVTELRAAGFTKARIAKELNHNSRHLQLGKEKLTVRNAAAMKRVHERLMVSDEALVPSGQTHLMIAKMRDEGYTTPQLLRAFCLDAADLPKVTATRVQRRVEKAVQSAFQILME